MTVVAIGAQSASAEGIPSCGRPQAKPLFLTRGSTTYGINVTEKVCVIKFPAARGASPAFEARVTTQWDATTNVKQPPPRFFDHFNVSVRLEQGGGNPQGDPDLAPPTKCRDIAKKINDSWRRGMGGSSVCATPIYSTSQLPRSSRNRKKSADGSVHYDIDSDGKGYRPFWSLHGSPLM